jgi:hypothetical protein
MNRSIRSAWVAALLLALPPASASACDTFTGMMNSSWDESQNWSDMTPPSAGVDACIPANMTVTGTSIEAGSIAIGAGSSVAFSAGASIGDGDSMIEGALVPGSGAAMSNAGHMVIGFTGSVGSNNAGTFTNGGTITINGDRTSVVALGLPVINTGTIEKVGGGAAKLQGAFDNNGTIVVHGGSLLLAGNRVSAFGADIGSYEVDPAGILDFEAGARTVNGAVTATGTVRFTNSQPDFTAGFHAATVDFAGAAGPRWSGSGPLEITSLQMNYGAETATFDRPAAITSALLGNGGVITGSASSAIQNLDWANGRLQGTGQLTLGSIAGNTGTSTARTAGFHVVERPVFITGRLDVTAGSGLGIGGPGELQVQPGGRLHLNGDGSHVDGLFKVVHNTGTIEKDGPGTTTFQPILDNQGTTKVAALGTLTLNDAPQQYVAASHTLDGGVWEMVTGKLVFPAADITTVHATLLLDGAGASIADGAAADGLRNLATVAAGGTLAVDNLTLSAPGALASAGTLRVLEHGTLDPAGALTLSGGRLEGSGTVAAPVTNEGATVAPGITASGGHVSGTLHLSSTYAQGAGGKLSVFTGGSIAGSPTDRLAIAGHADLGGTLEVTTHATGPAAEGESFTVATFADRTGEFATKLLPSPGGDLFYTVAHEAADVLVKVLRNPTPVPAETATPTPAPTPEDHPATLEPQTAPPAPAPAVFEGGLGADTVVATPTLTTLFGYAGNDQLTGAAAADTLWGGLGADVLSGLAGNDQLFGGAGPDTLTGGPGNDTLGHAGAVITATPAATPPPGANALGSGSILRNPGAEEGTAGFDATTTTATPGWTATKGQIAQVHYGARGGFPTYDNFESRLPAGGKLTYERMTATDAHAQAGEAFFAGGPIGTGAFDVGAGRFEAAITQMTDLSSLATQIDKRYYAVWLFGFTGGYRGQQDRAAIEAEPLSAQLLPPPVDPVGDQKPYTPLLTYVDPQISGAFMQESESDGIVVPGTRHFRVTIHAYGYAGNYNDGYAEVSHLVLLPRSITLGGAAPGAAKKAKQIIKQAGIFASAARTVKWTGDGNGLESLVGIPFGTGGYLIPMGLTPSKFDGGPGNDRIFTGVLKQAAGKPGAGVSFGRGDRVKGGAGNDTIDARNGRADTVDCGPGRDSVIAERFDKLKGCEKVRRARVRRG